MLVKVKVTEILERIICVEAQDANEGLFEVTTAYAKGEVALNENDLSQFKIERYKDK